MTIFKNLIDDWWSAQRISFIIVKNAFDFVKHKNTNGKFLRELILFAIDVPYTR